MARKNLKGVDLAIGILLILVVTAAVLPSAFDTWFDAPYYEDPENPGEFITDWPSMLVSLWELVPLFAILGIAIMMYRKAGGQNATNTDRNP